MIRSVFGGAVAASLLLCASGAHSTEYYVSAARGKGKEATKEQPAKDLGNIIAQLKDGDVVHIAEGTYLSRGETGSDQIPVAVQLIGGYDQDFGKRDPWGEHRTIFTGTNAISGSTQYRLIVDARQCKSDIVIDGIIFDNGPRNRYTSDKSLAILRKANPSTNTNATPESGGLRVNAGAECRVSIKNNAIANTAPTGGALSVFAGRSAKVAIANNLIINNTGEGIFAGSVWHPRTPGQELPEYQISGNTVLFSWKHDAIATYGGNGLMSDTDIKVNAIGNVFGFGDYGGVNNIKLTKGVTLVDNLFTGNRLYDYQENVPMSVDKLEDEADLVSKGSKGNISKQLKVPVGDAWASIYADRKEISRASVDASAHASNSGANALRGMLGLPLRANGVATDAEIWLPRIALDDALRTGANLYEGKYGCHSP